MTRTCLICSKRHTKNGSRSFHMFPKDMALRRKWLDVLQIKDGSYFSIYNYICSDHFKPDDIYVTPIGKNSLRKGSVPSIFTLTVPLSFQGSTTPGECFQQITTYMEKGNLSSNFLENSTINSESEDNIYNLSPEEEIHIKDSESEEEAEEEMEGEVEGEMEGEVEEEIILECVEEQVVEVPDPNEISPAVEYYISCESDDEVNGPTESPIEETVVEVADTEEIAPATEDHINSESEDEVNVPTENPREKTLLECSSNSSTLTAMSEDPFITDNPSDPEEAADVFPDASIVSKTHLAFEENLAKRRKNNSKFNGNRSVEYNRTRAQSSWFIARKTILDQKKKISNIQMQNRRLKRRIENLNTMLTYLFNNYEFQKKG